MEKNCRSTPEDILNHNKGIFHIGQCPACYSAETIEPDKERKQLAGQILASIVAGFDPKESKYSVNDGHMYLPEMVSDSIKAADLLLNELNK